MGIFDSYFDPQTYNGGMGNGLLSYLSEALKQKAGLPQDQGPQPTSVIGGAGAMPVPTFGQPDTTTLSAQSVQPQAHQAQPLPQQSPQMAPLQQLPAQSGNFLENMAGILNPEVGAHFQAQRNQQAIFQALRPLLGDNLAQAATLDPEIRKTIAPQLYSKPTLQKVSSDPLTGQESYVWSQPDKMQVTPAVVNGQPVSGARNGNVINPLAPTNVPAGVVPMGSNELKQVRDAVQSGATGDDFIKQLPNRAFADKVKGIANGDLPYPTGFIMKTPYGQMLTDAVSAYKPGVTAQDFRSKQKVRDSFTSGPDSNEVKAINTAIYHANVLSGVSDKMGGVDTAPGYINPVIQGAKNNFPQLDPGFQTAKKNWDATSETLAVEISKAINGGKPHIADKEHWRAIFDAANGPAQRTAAIQAAMNLLEGRTHTLSDKYEQGQLGAKDPYEFISPENQPIFSRLQAGKGAAPQASPQAAPQPQTAVNPKTGQRIMLKGNQWVPVQ
ncbi:MAG TPA: hypothetical protein VGR76_05540 [Candidatus Angelobacter sp.]|nr:hypothetical protein [Candidatus Angelobacter sp.]